MSRDPWVNLALGGALWAIGKPDPSPRHAGGWLMVSAVGRVTRDPFRAVVFRSPTAALRHLRQLPDWWREAGYGVIRTGPAG